MNEAERRKGTIASGRTDIERWSDPGQLAPAARKLAVRIRLVPA